MFENHGLIDKALPVGNFILAVSEGIVFSSTSKWYRLSSNQDIIYTSGITHVESDDLVLPVSLSGAEISLTSPNLVSSVVSKYTDTEGREIGTVRSLNRSYEQEIRESDISAFIASNSFSRSFFKGLRSFLPNWLSLSNPADSVLSISELVTNVQRGSEIKMNRYCKSSPVQDERLYNTFVFSSELILEVFGEYTSIITDQESDRICIVTDLQKNDGTFYVSFPPRPPFDLSVFNNIVTNSLVTKRSSNDIEGLTVNDVKGFALSLNKGIKVESEGHLEVWNGDHRVKYV